MLSDGKNPILSLSFDPSRSGAELKLGTKSAGVTAVSGGEHKLRILLDASVAECIVDGHVFVTERCYTAPTARVLVNIGERDLDAITALHVWQIKPISKDRLSS